MEEKEKVLIQVKQRQEEEVWIQENDGQEERCSCSSRVVGAEGNGEVGK